MPEISTYDSPDGSLIVHAVQFDGVAVVRAVGEIDLSTRDLLRQSLSEVDRDVVVDLAGVTLLDSSGLGVLAVQHRRMADAGHRFRLANAMGQVRDVLEILGMSALLDDRPTPADTPADVTRSRIPAPRGGRPEVPMAR